MYGIVQLQLNKELYYVFIKLVPRPLPTSNRPRPTVRLERISYRPRFVGIDRRTVDSGGFRTPNFCVAAAPVGSSYSSATAVKKPST